MYFILKLAFVFLLAKNTVFVSENKKCVAWSVSTVHSLWLHCLFAFVSLFSLSIFF